MSLSASLAAEAVLPVPIPVEQEFEALDTCHREVLATLRDMAALIDHLDDKGVDAVALKIREVAGEHDVPIVENVPLARALYRNGQVGRAIGQGEFVAVADIYIMLRRTLQQTVRS